MGDWILYVPSVSAVILAFLWWALGIYPLKMRPMCKVCNRQIVGWQSNADGYHSFCKDYVNSQDDLIAMYEQKIENLEKEIKILTQQPQPGGKSLKHPITVKVSFKKDTRRKDGK